MYRHTLADYKEGPFESRQPQLVSFVWKAASARHIFWISVAAPPNGSTNGRHEDTH